MERQIVPRLHKWPFFVGDALMLALACLIYVQSAVPLGRWEIVACVLCVAAGAALAALPFLAEHRAAVKLAGAERLGGLVAQIKDMEKVAAAISNATSRWQTAQDSANETVNVAKDIAERMTAEAKDFQEFLQRANEGERSTLRLEVEKLRRVESEWLQVLVRVLDHVFALHQAAVRSGQPSLIEQLGNFQNACRDAARRVGLIPFVPAPEERFDARVHQLAEENDQPSPDAAVDETIATGYTFQGRILRPALVRLRSGNEPAPVGVSASSLEDQNQSPPESRTSDAV